MPTVLYVDDEASLCEITRLYLQKSGDFSVDTAPSAPLALEKIRQTKYDVIVSDYQMPGMDGIQFLQKLRSLGNKTPFIIFTGKGREDVAIQALNSGADFYLQKGGEPRAQFAELVHKISHAVSRRQAEEALKASEEKYRRIIETANEGIWQLDGQCVTTYVNHKMAEMLGYTTEEMMGREATSFMHADDIADHNIHMEARKRGWDDHYERRLVKKDGSFIWTIVSATALFNPDGTFNGSVGMFTNITQRKNIEQELYKSLSFLNNLIDQSPISMWISDEKGILININKVCCDTLNLSEKEVVGKYNIFQDNNVKEQGFLPQVEDVYTQGRVAHFQLSYDTAKLKPLKIGRPVSVILDVTIFPVKDTKGKISNAVIQHINITERKQAEEALRKSEERYRNVVEDQTEFICRFTPDSRLTFVNEAFCRYFNLDKTRCLTGYHSVTLSPEDARLMKQHLASLTPKNPVAQIEHRIIMPSGKVRWQRWSDRAIFDDIGNIVEFQSVGRDITEQKQAEEARQESEELLALAIEGAHLGLWDIYYTNRTIRHNRFWNEVLGYVAEETTTSLDSWRTTIHPDDLLRIEKITNDHLSGKTPVLDMEYRIRHKGGSWLWIHTIGKVVSRSADNKPLRMSGINQDITERKQAEEALKESERKFREIFNKANDAIHLFEIEKDGRFGTFIDVNDVACQMVQYSRDEMLQRGPLDITRDYPGQSRDKIFKELRTVGHATFETRHVRKDGTIVPVEINAHVITLFGRKVVLSVVRDITERKKVEETLRESEERFKAIFHNQQTGLIMVDAATHVIVDANKKALSLFGAAQEDVIGKVCHTYICREELGRCPVTDLGKIVDESERTLINAKGERVSILKSVNKTEIGGKPYLIESFIDITKRNQAEDALRESEERYSSLFDNNNSISLLIDPDTGKIVDANAAAARYYGYTQNELTELGIYDLNRLPREKIVRDLQQAKHERAKHFFSTHYLASGKMRNVEIYSGPITVHGKSHFYSIIHDITKRKQAEEALALAVKKLNLLSSITRHDIQNQLLVLRSYIEISREYLDDRKNLLDLIEKEEKVTTTIEHQIRFTRNYQDMGVKAPVWQNINESIQKAVSRLPMRDIRVEVDRTRLEIFADPLFEKVFYNLIDNALQYGGEHMTRIRISSEKSSKGLTIVCEDDGAGIAEEDKKELFTKGFGKNTGLGLFLCHEILAITGIAIVENSTPRKGARFELWVPKGGYRFAGKE